MKYLAKILFRSIHKARGRYLSLIAIVFLGVGFFSGLVNAEPSMSKTETLYLDQHDFFDYELLSNQGFTTDQLKEIQQISGVDHVEGGFFSNQTGKVMGKEYALTLLSLTKKVNCLKLVSGHLPSSQKECVVDSHLCSKKVIGKELSLALGTFTIVGIVDSPLYLSLDRSDVLDNTAHPEGFAYLLPDAFPLPVYQVLWVRAPELKHKALEKYCDHLLTPDDNVGYLRFHNDTTIVNGIAAAFPAFFILIAALVCVTTMTRMINEDRTQIGTLKSMGVSADRIILLYLSYSVSAILIGCLAGYGLGTFWLPRILWSIYHLTYDFAPLSYAFLPWLFTGCLLVSLFTSIFVTWFVCGRELLEKPASLIRPKAPSSGKKILLEYLPGFWNRLHFLTKISLRNTFRYKKKMLMTIIGISGCSCLIVTGFGIRDTVVNALADASDLLNDSLSSMNYIVYVLIICAAALSLIVLYNLTNINIMERTKEIATVKVLGFHLQETAGYVLNENLILAAIGGLLGMPLGRLLHWYVLEQIVVEGFTFNSTIKVRSYLYSLGLTLLFTLLSNFLMKRKIHQIPMAESLKAVE